MDFIYVVIPEWFGYLFIAWALVLFPLQIYLSRKMGRLNKEFETNLLKYIEALEKKNKQSQT